MRVEQRSDEALWSLAVSGDPDAYAGLYTRHADRVFTHCLRRTAARNDAEDLTAEVFAETWRQRDRVQVDPEGGGLLPWLLGTANNLLRRRHRDHFRRDNLTRRLAGRHSDVADHADDVIGSVDDLRDLQRLTWVLKTLDPRDQDVIHLCVIEGLTPAAVALTFGEPAGTIRSRLSRALTRARRANAELPGGPHDTLQEVRHDR